MNFALNNQVVNETSEHEVTAPLALEQLDLHDLRELMQSVMETSDRLQQTHITLHDHVARLQRELAEANDQLRRSRSLAALGEMAAGIAHEIRNPLGSIQLYVQVLTEELRDCGRDDQAKLCEKIRLAVTGMDAIVRDVLSFARDMRIDPQPTTAQMLLCRALHSCQSLLVNTGIEVRQSDADFMVHADHGLMTQALANIIRNAVEAIQHASEHAASEGRPHAKLLRLEASRHSVRLTDGTSDERIVLAVEDSGDGIPDDVIDRMFNPFFTTRKTGTGLGLAIVHRIVDAHGGIVRVSKLPRGGTRMELCLKPEPCSRSKADRDPESRNGLSRPIVCDIEVSGHAESQDRSHAQKSEPILSETNL